MHVFRVRVTTSSAGHRMRTRSSRSCSATRRRTCEVAREVEMVRRGVAGEERRCSRSGPRAEAGSRGGHVYSTRPNSVNVAHYLFPPPWQVECSMRNERNVRVVVGREGDGREGGSEGPTRGRGPGTWVVDGRGGDGPPPQWPRSADCDSATTGSLAAWPSIPLPQVQCTLVDLQPIPASLGVDARLRSIILAPPPP